MAKTSTQAKYEAAAKATPQRIKEVQEWVAQARGPARVPVGGKVVSVPVEVAKQLFRVAKVKS